MGELVDLTVDLIPETDNDYVDAVVGAVTNFETVERVSQPYREGSK